MKTLARLLIFYRLFHTLANVMAAPVETQVLLPVRGLPEVRAAVNPATGKYQPCEFNPASGKWETVAPDFAAYSKLRVLRRTTSAGSPALEVEDESPETDRLPVAAALTTPSRSFNRVATVTSARLVGGCVPRSTCGRTPAPCRPRPAPNCAPRPCPPTVAAAKPMASCSSSAVKAAAPTRPVSCGTLASRSSLPRPMPTRPLIAGSARR